MAAATTNADSFPSETLTDNALIGEIAPTMLDKLKLDGRRAARSACALLMFWALGAFNSLRPYDDRNYVEVVKVALLLVAIGSIVGGLTIHGYFERYNVRAEIKYRRQHGKWRWDH